MKTRELIAMLQEEDPSGALEVCVSNEPIYIVERIPAYYDGLLGVLVQDETKGCYNIIGYKMTQRGDKVRLQTMGLDDCMLDHPELPVDLSECSEQDRERWEPVIEQKRKELREMHARIDAKYPRKEPDGHCPV